MQGIEALAAQAGQAIAERDAVQANLLELDASFGKRMLDGAALTGRTRQRWETAQSALGELWETFTAYTAVIDRLAELARRPSPGRERELAALLDGRPVTLDRAPAPLRGRDLADTGRLELSLAAAVAAMRRAFACVTEVTTAAEAVWTEVTSRLDPVAEQIARARPLLAGLDDDALTAGFRDAEARLEALRGQLNSDPLSLWSGSQADLTAVTLLDRQVSGLAPRIAELDRLRREAGARIENLRVAAGQVRADRAALEQAAARAATRVTGLPPLPVVAAPPLDALTALAAAGRWSRLAADLGRWEAAIEESRAQIRDTERIVASLLAQRSELRGLLDAYKAKASRLVGAEDPELGEKYQCAHDLLWTAPCDLAAATAAVTGYQQAILARGREKKGGR